ncbi:MAG: hypothetical protein ACLSHO_05310 [Dysosmobacter sp.]
MGMLTGVRPDKPITRALMEGKTPDEAKRELKTRYFVPEDRAALALETGAVGYQALKRLESGISTCMWVFPSVPPAAPTAPLSVRAWSGVFLWWSPM